MEDAGTVEETLNPDCNTGDDGVDTFQIPNVAICIPFANFKLVLGAFGIWLNRRVLVELRIVRTQQIVNSLVSYTCFGCLALSLLQILEGLR